MAFKYLGHVFYFFFSICLLSSYSISAAHAVAFMKNRWSSMEDELLKRAAAQSEKKYGVHKWQFIASQVISRDSKQCKERWQNSLAPGYDRQPLSDDEKKYISQRQREIGNQWKKISQELNRSSNQVKNFFHGLNRKSNGHHEYELLVVQHNKLPHKFLALLEVAEQYYQEEMDCRE